MSHVEQEHTQTGPERGCQPRLHTMHYIRTCQPTLCNLQLRPQTGLRAQGCRQLTGAMLAFSRLQRLLILSRAQMKSQQGWVASGTDFRKLVERMESIFFSRWKKKKKSREGRQEEARQRKQPVLCNHVTNNQQEEPSPNPARPSPRSETRRVRRNRG